MTTIITEADYVRLRREGAVRVKALRERLGETHGDFAKRFGVARPTIIHWETKGPPVIGPGRHHIERIMGEIEDGLDSGTDRSAERTRVT
jgi:transcriptional regulator with XRE-family HTH domain